MPMYRALMSPPVNDSCAWCCHLEDRGVSLDESQKEMPDKDACVWRTNCHTLTHFFCVASHNEWPHTYEYTFFSMTSLGEKSFTYPTYFFSVTWRMTSHLYFLITSDVIHLRACICSQYAVVYPGIWFGGGGSTNSVEDRENGDLGAVAP